MIWTIVAVAAVVATKLVTALRLKDLKAKLESIQPDIDDHATQRKSDVVRSSSTAFRVFDFCNLARNINIEYLVS